MKVSGPPRQEALKRQQTGKKEAAAQMAGPRRLNCQTAFGQKFQLGPALQWPWGLPAAWPRASTCVSALSYVRTPGLVCPQQLQPWVLGKQQSPGPWLSVGFRPHSCTLREAASWGRAPLPCW